ncbi:hypothetical protein DY000_02037387 [Brassica cretica]|uniref:Uncharacterized protein n=1 Tax=Brassica cretica TaxID=69181 RepID=A0ABQ7BME3_BRACR|nr:hypothetical protein DY000_02037387 [Brassica cretica]
MSNRLVRPIPSRTAADSSSRGSGPRGLRSPPCQSAQSLTGRSPGWMPKECIKTLLDAAGCSRTLQADPLHT